MHRAEVLSGEVPAARPADLSILLLEDEEHTGDTLRILLQPLATHVAWCRTVRQAEMELARRTPDLLILDVGLPDGDGLSICRALKQQTATNAVPIMIVSALAEGDLRLEALRNGADHVMLKPPSLGELLTRAEALLRARAITRALDSKRSELQMRRDWMRYLAHDLRNALSVMLANADFLTTAPLETEFSDALKDLSYQLNQTHRLVADLVDSERLRQGALVAQRKSCEVVDLVRQAVRQIRPLLSTNRLEAVLSGLANLNASVDPDLLGRTLQNLLGNAARYAPAGSQILVEVSCKPDGESRTARIAVTNRGPAIPEDARERIFEPFVRLDDRPGTGAGLGLAFCALAVRAHGGRIWVDAPPGGGARFLLSLPLT